MSIIKVNSDGENIVINDVIYDNLVKRFLNLNGKEYGSQSTLSQIVAYDQKILNYLDSIKDGTPPWFLKKARTYPLPVGQFPEYTKLSTIEMNVENELKYHFIPRSWNKLSKGSLIDEPIEVKYLFYDVGLSPSNYVKDFSFVKTFATYLDPGPKIDSSSTELWPLINQTISISKNFMNLFGFDNVSLNATTLSQGFDFVININDYQITPYNIYGKISGNATKNNIFVGLDTNSPDQNFKEKNGILISKNLGDPYQDFFQNANILIILKELGDKLQVLFAFLWMLTNKNVDYSVITHDKVVFTLCLSLNMNVIFTGYEGDKYEIKFYQPNKLNKIDTLKFRFKKNYSEIKEHNEIQIKLINFLLKSSKPIYFGKSGSSPIKLSQIFYNKLKFYLEFIINNLSTLNVENDYDEISILNKIDQLKKIYTIKSFIREVAGKIILFTDNKLTDNFSLKYNKRNTTFVYMAMYLNNSNYYEFKLYSKSDQLLEGDPGFQIGGGRRVVAPKPEDARALTNKFPVGDIGKKKDPRLLSRNLEDVANAYIRQEEENKILLNNTDFYNEPIIEYNKNEFGQITMMDINKEQQKFIKNEISLKIYEEFNKLYFEEDYIFNSIYNDILFKSFLDNGSPVSGPALSKIIEEFATELLYLIQSDESASQEAGKFIKKKTKKKHKKREKKRKSKKKTQNKKKRKTKKR